MPAIDRQSFDPLFAQLERELEPEQDAARAAALCCRLALLCWDLDGDTAAAERWLRRAEPGQPQSLELRRQLLLARGDAASAAVLLEEQAARVPASEARPLLTEAALLRLLWLRDARGALGACLAVPEPGAELEVLGELAALAADDARVLADRAASPSATSTTLALVGAVLWDTEHDAERAAELLRRAHLLDEGSSYVLELLIEVASCLPDRQELASLEAKKLALLSAHRRDSADARAITLSLARLLGELGRGAEAIALLDQIDPLVDDLETTNPRGASALNLGEAQLLETRRCLSARVGDARQLARAYQGLTELSQVPAFARAYRLRAAQLLARTGDEKQCAALVRQNFEENRADPHSALELEALRIRQGAVGELCAQYEEQAAAYPDQKPLLRRKAALVAEAHLHDATLAADLRRDGLALAADRYGQGDLQRLYRAMASDARLLESCLREAETSVDAARAALAWSAVAVLRLKLGQIDEAEHAASEALGAQEDDPLALEVVAWIHRHERRELDLKAHLARQVELLRSPQARAACLRELALVSRNAGMAYEHLRRALELDPDHPATLAELVDLCERLEQYPEAVEHAVRLAELVRGDPARAAEVLVRLGRLHQRTGDAARSLEAFARSVELDPDSLEALRELARLHRERDDPHQLLECLRRLLQLEPDHDARASLQLEAARALESVGRGPDELIEAYSLAVRAERTRADALGDLERVCREAGRVDAIARALGELPATPAVLQLSARVLEELGDRDALADVLAQLIALTTSPLERADRRYELGRLLEALGQSQSAVAQYEEVLADVAGHQPALGALERIYRADERSSALLRVLQQELVTTSDRERQAEILMELARALEDVGHPAQAAARLEELLALKRDNLEAIWSLERLYELERPLDLARVLRHHADVETHTVEKATLLLRAGQIWAEQASPEPAAAALREAFDSAPGNRDVFTYLEAFLYERERYQDLMELYERALRFVEEDGGRAYRPVDLWSRRGQLQLKHLGQPGEAAASYLKALEYDPKSESAMKMLETIFVQQQDWRGLVRAYEQRANLVVSNELFRLESLRQAARLAQSRLPGEPEEAQRLWEEIYSLDPIDEEALDSLEQLYDREAQGEKLVALLEHRAALGTNDDARLAIYLRVAELCEQELEDPERAAAAYESVRRIEEHHEQALKALARIYEATGRWDRCLEVLRDLVIMEADPDERSLLYFKCGSIVESRFSDDAEAIRYYEAALAEAEGCLPAVHGLRDLYLRREDWNRALETLELEVNLWEEKREQAGVLARMAEIRLVHLKDVPKAIAQFEDALALDPECQAAALALFNLCYERRENKRAHELAEQLVPRMAKEGDPETRSAFYSRRGQILAAAGLEHAAAESLVVALELRPRNLEALDWLIALCRRSPDAYDFASIFRELEQVYRREGAEDAVGHVLVAAGALSEIAGDVDTALARYREAVEAAPQDLTPVFSLAELLVKLRRPEEACEALRAHASRTAESEHKLRALGRMAEVISNVMLDAERASAVYLEMLASDPGNSEASERLAQELYLLGRVDEAQRIMRALLDRAQADGTPARELSRYTHYLGVLLQRVGDLDGALEQFRRALQLDATNAAAVMALARQMVLTGDRGGAARLLERTIGESRETPSASAADLRRSLAGLYLGAGDVSAAVTCYEAVVRESAKLEDRLALAEALAGRHDTIPRARAVLREVIAEDATNLNALRLEAQLHGLSGEPDRELQVMKVVETLGGADDQELVKLATLRRQAGGFKLSGVLDDALRGRLCPPAVDVHVARLWSALREPLEKLFGQESPPAVRPLAEVGSPQLRQLCEWCMRLHGVSPSVQIGEDVPGGVLLVGDAAGRVVLDGLFLERPLPEVAFTLGRSLEYLRSGHALISRLAFDDRQLLAELLAGTLQAPASTAANDLVQEFKRGLPRRVTKAIDEVVASYRAQLAAAGEAEQPKRWLAHVDRAASNLGLLTCDDLGAALRMVAQLAGQELPSLDGGGGLAVRFISDGPELVKLFLSDEYLEVRRALTRV